MTAATFGVGQGWPTGGWPTAFGAPLQMRPLQIRKNAKHLTADEKARFVGAIKALKQTPSPWSTDVSTYDEFVRWHSNAFLGDVMPGHLAPAFFPWHRMLNHLFEQQLQMIDPTVAIPYWDWAVDRTPDAYLWQDDFLGGDGDPTDNYIVKAGPFRQGEWPITIFDVEDDYKIPALVRAFRTDKRATELPTEEDEEELLGIARYDVAPWSDDSPPNESVRRFAEDGHGCPRSKSSVQAPASAPAQVPASTPRPAASPASPGPSPQPASARGAHHAPGRIDTGEACENGPGMHNRVHLWVGGKFGDPKKPAVGPMALGVAPNDPVFWLLHANIDRLWVEWQLRHGQVYAPESGGPFGHNVDDPMTPYDTIGMRITPRMMLDHHALGYAYDIEPMLTGLLASRTPRLDTSSRHQHIAQPASAR